MASRFTIQDTKSRCDDITDYHQALLPLLLSDLRVSTFTPLYDLHRGEITTVQLDCIAKMNLAV